MSELNLNEIFDRKVSSITETMSTWNLDKVYDLLSSINDKISAEHTMTSAEIEAWLSSIFSGEETPDVDTLISATLSSLDEQYPEDLDFLSEEELFNMVDEYESTSGEIDISSDYAALCAEIEAEENEEDEPVGLKKRESSLYMDFYKGFIKGQTDRTKLQVYEEQTKQLAARIDTIRTEPLPDFDDIGEYDPHCTPTINYCDFIDEKLTPKYKEILNNIKDTENIVATLGYWNGLNTESDNSDKIFKYIKFLKIGGDNIDVEKLSENGEDKLAKINIGIFNWSRDKDEDENEELTEGKFKRIGEIEESLEASIDTARTEIGIVIDAVGSLDLNKSVGGPIRGGGTATQVIKNALLRLKECQADLLQYTAKNRRIVKDATMAIYNSDVKIGCKDLCNEIVRYTKEIVRIADSTSPGTKLTPAQVNTIRFNCGKITLWTKTLRNITYGMQYSVNSMKNNVILMRDGIVFVRDKAPNILRMAALSGAFLKTKAIPAIRTAAQIVARAAVAFGPEIIAVILVIAFFAAMIYFMYRWEKANGPFPRSANSKAIKIMNASAENLVKATNSIANELKPIYNGIRGNVKKELNHHRKYLDVSLNEVQYKIALEGENDIGFIIDEEIGEKRSVYEVFNSQLLEEYAQNGGDAEHVVQLGFFGSINGFWWQQQGDDPWYFDSLDEIIDMLKLAAPGDTIVIDAGYYDDISVYTTENEQQQSINVCFWDSYTAGEHFELQQYDRVYGVRVTMTNYYREGENGEEDQLIASIPSVQESYPAEYPYVTMPEVEDPVIVDDITVQSGAYWKNIESGLIYQPGEQVNIENEVIWKTKESLNFELCYEYDAANNED